MTKLTKSIRENMARKLVAYRYTDEAKAIIAKGKDLTKRVYKHLYPDDLLAHMDAVAKHYPRAFQDVKSLAVNAGGYSVRLCEQFHSRWVSVAQVAPSMMRTVYEHWDSHSISDDTLSQEVKDYATDLKNFDDVCATAYHEALAVLNSMSTGKKLAEAWPEAMEVIGDLIPEGNRTLPVVQVSAINAKFKLPPKTKETK